MPLFDVHWLRRDQLSQLVSTGEELDETGNEASGRSAVNDIVVKRNGEAQILPFASLAAD